MEPAALSEAKKCSMRHAARIVKQQTAARNAKRPQSALNTAFLKRGSGRHCSTHGVDGSRKFRAADGRIRTLLVPKQRRGSIPTQMMVRRPSSAPPGRQTEAATATQPATGTVAEELARELRRGELAAEERKNLEKRREELAAARKKNQEER